MTTLYRGGERADPASPLYDPTPLHERDDDPEPCWWETEDDEDDDLVGDAA